MKNIPPCEQANPQGKGLIPLLTELQSRKPAKTDTTSLPLAKVLQDYALSRLVLCAEFNFKPVIQQAYYLYAKDFSLRLSLIAPSEWKDQRFGIYICQCSLTESMTWFISKRNEDAEAQMYLSLVMDKLKQTLLDDLFTDDPFLNSLPDFDDRLPFHRRVLANGLSSYVRAQLGSGNKSFQQLCLEEFHTGNLFLSNN